MRKFFQTEWHGIPFASFTKPSSEKLADSTFYSSFYKSFFQRYKQWEDLQPEWVQLKLQATEFIQGHFHHGKAGTILSIGCGLGIIEKALWDGGFSNLEITEVSKEPLRWVLHIPQKNMHIGFFPDCIPPGKNYEFIYLAGVEYFFDQTQLISFLAHVRTHLTPGGHCLLISWSFEFTNRSRLFKNIMIDYAKFILEKLKIKHRGQFWGYIRNRDDFLDTMNSAGFSQIADGFLEKKTPWKTYWIEGSNK